MHRWPVFPQIHTKPIEHHKFYFIEWQTSPLQQSLFHLTTEFQNSLLFPLSTTIRFNQIPSRTHTPNIKCGAIIIIMTHIISPLTINLYEFCVMSNITTWNNLYPILAAPTRMYGRKRRERFHSHMFAS